LTLLLSHFLLVALLLSKKCANGAMQVTHSLAGRRFRDANKGNYK